MHAVSTKTSKARIGVDKTIRIWDNQARAEMARLSHNARVTNVLWLENDAGVVSLGEDGMVSKWARTVSTAR